MSLRRPQPVARPLVLHGHGAAYRAAGAEGLVIVLLHGITSTSAT